MTTGQRARVLLALLVLLAGCGSADRREPAPVPTGPEPATVATATVDVVEVRAAPEDPAASAVLDRRTGLSGAVVLLVLERRPDWLRVLLPTAPAGSTGWVRAADVALAADPYSVEVALGAHTLTVRRGADEVLTSPVAVGTSDRLTPGVPYYVTELLRPPDPAGPYGPYLYALSGTTSSAEAVAAGRGLLAISGTGAPQRLGTDVPDGCVLLASDVVTRLVEQLGLPLGTPVSVLP